MFKQGGRTPLIFCKAPKWHLYDFKFLWQFAFLWYNNNMKQSVYKYILIDEFGDSLRKFANKTEATPYLTNGAKLVKLPPQPNQYEMATLLLEEAPL